METVFVLETNLTYYEGGPIIGIFATEEDARKAFWREAEKEEYIGDLVAITSHLIGTSSLWNQKTVAQFERQPIVIISMERLQGAQQWKEVTSDD